MPMKNVKYLKVYINKCIQMKSIYMQLTIIFAQQKPCALSKETENLIMGNTSIYQLRMYS